MVTLNGSVQRGVGDFKRRIMTHPQAFEKDTGEKLFPGTINVNVGQKVAMKEHFRVRGVDIGEPQQDLQFEICRINGIWAYRIRPFNLVSGEGGHGDHVLEIACSVELPHLDEGTVVEVALFRTELS